MLKKQTKAQLLALIQQNLNHNYRDWTMTTKLTELYLEVEKEDSDNFMSQKITIGLGFAGSFLGGIVFSWIAVTVAHLLN